MNSNPRESDFDRRLRTELHDVAVPDSLEQRLQAKILGANEQEVFQSSASDLKSSPSIEHSVARAFETDQGNSHESSPTVRRREWPKLLFPLAGLAAAATIGFLIFHFATTPAGITKQAFAAWMENKLEGFENSDEQTIPHSLPPTVLAFLTQNVRLHRMGVSGEYEISTSKGQVQGKGFAWKLVGEDGVLYVAVLEDISLTESLPPSLEVIQNSGPWNLAATSREGKILLVAARGDIRRYFKPRPFA